MLWDRFRWCIGRKQFDEPTDRLLSVFEHIRTELPDDKITRRRHCASSWSFNFLVVFATVANTILIGLESDNSRGIRLEDRLPWFLIEVLFTCIFFAEMLLRVNQFSWDYFMDAWNVFDYCLVVFSVADIEVVSVAKSDGSGLRWAASARVFRSLRVARAIRGEKLVMGLFRITQGFLDALKSMLWTFVAASIFAYMLAVALTSLVGSDTASRELWPESDLYCGTVTRSLFTVLQIMTMDCVSETILRPMSVYAPLGLMVAYFSMLVLSFGVLNILFAIMVDGRHLGRDPGVESNGHGKVGAAFDDVDVGGVHRRMRLGLQWRAGLQGIPQSPEDSDDVEEAELSRCWSG
ncbi:unnamed protein product [Effrenium voratum]|uniref:Ion transport domain-containing protein n=1 Tax=Effrenium voratum TaxID=2562239 RepID=A0AA36I8D5_9DINO|nr:unnamed protein product [Effrenium voratum]CAJ1421735.1 unnamed protein product [Effrenium voratum]